jgi:HTH-type transcriptional regulator, competence development regulator
MTPFGELIKRLRISRGLQQTQLALGAGISPCYYSSIESGIKGPPSQKVFDKLVQELRLKDEEAQELLEAASASKRTYTIPFGLDLHEQLLAKNLWRRLGSITPEQAKCIEMILKINERG